MDLDDELRRLFADERLDVPVRQQADRVVVAGAARLRRRRRSGVVLGGGMLSVAAMLIAGTAFGGDAPPRVPMAAADSSGRTSTTMAAPMTTTPLPRTATITSSSTFVVDRPMPTTHTTGTTSTKATPTTKATSPGHPLAFGPTTVDGLRLGMTPEDAMATGLIQPNATPVDAAGCRGYDWAGHAKAPSYYSVLFSPKYGLVRIGGLAEAKTPEGIFVGSSEADVRALYPDQAMPHIGGGEWVTPVPGNPNAHYWFVFVDHVVTDVRLELAVQDCYQ